MSAATSKPSIDRRRRWPIVLTILVVAGVLAWGGHRLATGTAAQQQAGRFGGFRGHAGPGGPGGGPATPVGAANATAGDIHVVINGLGTVLPLRTVTVSAQVAGQLQTVDFKEGQHVDKGAVLAQIDPRSYQAALAQAQGNLARDQAQLANARVDLARYQTLFKQDSIAKQQLDTQAALVRQLEGAVQADQGSVAVAQVNFGYTRILAPDAGRVGLRQVDPGNNIGNGSAIASITQMQPMDVLFTIPEDSLPALREKLRAGTALPVVAYDRSGKTQLATGTLASLDNQIDTSTGTIKVKARFANADEALFPNQFVNVRLMLDTLADATVIPASAIQRGSDGLFVYVIGADDTVAVRTVTAGVTEGDRVQILTGLKPGERVVTDGTDRLRDGSRVSVPTLKGGGAASSLIDTLPSPASDAGGWKGRGQGSHRGGWSSGRRGHGSTASSGSGDGG
ncbi:MAG: MdtA/MuxA family multidrug efflux RND transporter periplasmic adaptor subunit [Proteobacteria bacterium]|nr:MdtA/MuxA family multidrug efflux RND transporter periplasmic adaptor subunit [Pseudomonadota bacterium]MBS0464694.1 MdtA/MuxA family multidrug efflux RND transporter periplasmic adaptor subunit [Pseudomonadota bacterium]